MENTTLFKELSQKLINITAHRKYLIFFFFLFWILKESL